MDLTDKTTVEIQNIATELDAMIRRTESLDSVDKGTIKKTDFDDRTKAEQNVEETKEDLKIVANIPNDSVVQSKTYDSVTKRTNVETSPTSAKIVTITASSTTTVQKVSKKGPTTTGALRIIESDDEGEIPETVRTFDDSTKSLESASTETALGSTVTVYENSSAMTTYKNGTTETTEKFDVRLVPLKDESTDEVEIITSSSSGRPKTVNVKDIIDSINKSQSLLKINYEDHKRRTSNGSINTRIRELERKETEINEMLNEIDLDQKVNGLCTSKSDTQIVEEEINEIPVVIRDLESQISREEDSGSLFQKCRPSSHQPNRPLSGDHDWNPLPKPKRSSPATSPAK